MTVVAEIHVLRETREIEVRVIPPDSICAAPDVLVVHSVDSPLGDRLLHRCLAAMGRCLDIRCGITNVCHGGADRYTVHTADGEFREVDLASNKRLASVFQEIAALVERSEFSQPNRLDGIKHGIGKAALRIAVNRVGGHGGKAHEGRRPVGFESPDSHKAGYLPGQVNRLPRKRREWMPKLPLLPPNKLRSA